MRPAHILSSPEAGLTLTELLVAIVISAIVSVILFTFFMQNEWGFLENQGTADVINTDRHALEVVANDIANAGYGFASIPGCTQIVTYNGNATPLNPISVTPNGTPTQTNPPPVSLTVYLGTSDFAGVPVGMMVDSPSPSASNFHINSAPGATTGCQTPIQKGDGLVAAFSGGECAMVYATQTPSSNAGACVVTFDHGENQNNPSGGFATLIPTLTTADMDAAQVYDTGASNITQLTYSVTPPAEQLPVPLPFLQVVALQVYLPRVSTICKFFLDTTPTEDNLCKVTVIMTLTTRTISAR
ncbi:prepilin-type N-terminal cleavage/methylation domain-containing protein [Acidithiobacillus sp. AMEEHan]|uniref:PilW family protein n=1 Tax=Acidithiobacillus sp. AMEEHan TaxID=2994951 RepID=UPI0027E52F60|nr:prepilin-type N-terminal cleavage/methylation domain-containing protein [Acidithiobacillus sp. AMEEHan]